MRIYFLNCEKHVTGTAVATAVPFSQLLIQFQLLRVDQCGSFIHVLPPRPFPEIQYNKKRIMINVTITRHTMPPLARAGGILHVDGTMQIFIKGRVGKRRDIDVEADNTIDWMKATIELITGIDAVDQLLYWGGHLLEDGRTLSSYGIAEGETVQVRWDEQGVNGLKNDGLWTDFSGSPSSSSSSYRSSAASSSSSSSPGPPPPKRFKRKSV